MSPTARGRPWYTPQVGGRGLPQEVCAQKPPTSPRRLWGQSGESRGLCRSQAGFVRVGHGPCLREFTSAGRGGCVCLRWSRWHHPLTTRTPSCEFVRVRPADTRPLVTSVALLAGRLLLKTITGVSPLLHTKPAGIPGGWGVSDEPPAASIRASGPRQTGVRGLFLTGFSLPRRGLRLPVDVEFNELNHHHHAK